MWSTMKWNFCTFVVCLTLFIQSLLPACLFDIPFLTFDFSIYQYGFSNNPKLHMFPFHMILCNSCTCFYMCNEYGVQNQLSPENLYDTGMLGINFEWEMWWISHLLESITTGSFIVKTCKSTKYHKNLIFHTIDNWCF